MELLGVEIALAKEAVLNIEVVVRLVVGADAESTNVEV